MKKLLFIIVLSLAVLMGCGVDSDKTRGTDTSHIPTVPRTADTTEVELANAKAKAQDEEAKEDAVNPCEGDLKKLLPGLNKNQVILENPTVTDKLTVYLIKHSGWGTAEDKTHNEAPKIVLNRAEKSRYAIRIQTPPAEPMLIIDRCTKGDFKQKKYPLTTLKREGDAQIYEVSDEKSNTKKNIQEYGDSVVREVVGFDDAGWPIYGHKIINPLFRQSETRSYKYRVVYKNKKWSVSFSTEQIHLFKKLRQEHSKGEQEQVFKTHGNLYDRRATFLKQAFNPAHYPEELRTQGYIEPLERNVFAVEQVISVEQSE